jgi:hypothetical protein
MTTRWERFQHEVVHGNVVLNFTSFPKGDLCVYAHAYQQAANSLVEEFRGKPYYSDAEASPIVFLYRHAVIGWRCNGGLRAISVSSPRVPQHAVTSTSGVVVCVMGHST